MTQKIKRMWSQSTYDAFKVFYERLNDLRAAFLADRVLGPTGLARGSTDDRVASGAFTYQIGAVTGQVNTFKSVAAVAAGTELPAGTQPINTWGVYLVSINAAGTIAVTAGALNFTTGYASEALALAAIPDAPANSAVMGYFTNLTEVGSTFIAGTDALQGGVTGNPASDTNYYEAGANYGLPIGEELEAF